MLERNKTKASNGPWFTLHFSVPLWPWLYLLGLAVIVICAPTQLVAQTGPAGVGTSASNILWLSAEQEMAHTGGFVSAWGDRSGNGLSAVQSTVARRPLLQQNVFNGYPALVFDNSQTDPDHLRVPDHPSLSSMSGLSAFSVFDLASGIDVGTPRCIFSKRNGVDVANAYGWFHWNGGSGTIVRQYFDINGTANRLTGTAAFGTGTTYLSSIRFAAGSTPTEMRQRLFLGNSPAGNKTITATSIAVTPADLYIGHLNGHPGTGAATSRFNGRIAEVILYNFALNETQRILVNNYLAAKYGLALSIHDLYTMDNPANGNHDHEMAGIGRISSTDQHIAAQGSAVVHIGNPTGLDNGEFLLWGHDNGILGTWNVMDHPNTLEGRWERVWRVNEVNLSGASVDVGAVDITFDLSGFNPVTADDLRLLVVANGNVLFADAVVTDGAVHIGNGQYRFAGVTALSNGSRFTLGTVDLAQTPLPVSLVSFAAEVTGPNTVDLAWSTASEQNNAYFTVERSTDMVLWEPVALVDGAGYSSTMISYRAVDGSAPGGLVYYRLFQTDGDDTTQLQGTLAVRLTAAHSIVLHPNPAQGQFHLRHDGGTIQRVVLLDAIGRVVKEVEPNNDRATVMIPDMPPGQYSVQVFSEDGKSVHRVVVTD